MRAYEEKRGARSERGRAKKRDINRRPTNLMNRAPSLSPPADDRSYSVLNFLRNATATNLAVLTRGIYATLTTKGRNYTLYPPEVKLKFHKAKINY